MRQAFLQKSLPFCLSHSISEIMDFKSCDYLNNNLLIHPEPVKRPFLDCHDSPGEDDFAFPLTQKEQSVIGLDVVPTPFRRQRSPEHRAVLNV